MVSLDIDESESKQRRLHKVFLHVTKACNLHCRYCYFSALEKPLPDEMTAVELRRVWPDLVALRPEKIVFTGGEPLLRCDMLELLMDLKTADPRHDVVRCLNTNGHRVTTEIARQLVGLVDEVRVSLDALAERNDSLRGEGNFYAALQALECLYAVGFEPKVLVTITSVSLPDLEELLSLLITKKFTRINLNLFRPIGRGAGHQEWQADPQALNAAIRRAWQRCYPGQPRLSEAPPPTIQSTCGVGRFLNIMPNGDVFPCHVLTQREFRCGNLRTQSLLEICQENNLLGQLAALDFRRLAESDVQLLPVARHGECLGNVYARTRSLPTWGRSLPQLAVD